jgi:hypothetical protein
MSDLDIRPLTGEAAARYRAEWHSLQSGFVDEPEQTVQEADRLVTRMMRDCGYPVDEFDQRADDISVDHPEVAQHYRSAHEIASAHTQGTADTEQLRKAVTSYRRLVVVLLDDDDRSGSDKREAADARDAADVGAGAAVRKEDADARAVSGDRTMSGVRDGADVRSVSDEDKVGRPEDDR